MLPIFTNLVAKRETKDDLHVGSGPDASIGRDSRFGEVHRADVVFKIAKYAEMVLAIRYLTLSD